MKIKVVDMMYAGPTTKWSPDTKGHSIMKAVPLGPKEQAMRDHRYARTGEPYEFETDTPLVEKTTAKAAPVTPAAAS